MMPAYRTSDVAFPGGQLRVGIWESADVAAGAPVLRNILAIHGITASHRSWRLVATSLTNDPRTRIVAPDLRGRGRSSSLPGPGGMPQHAHDLHTALDALEIDHCTVVGHSMGGFVAVVLAHLYGDRVRAVVLVDGGIPIPAPPGLTSEESVKSTLGPAAARLAMTFPSRGAYRDFWRGHPAFANDWSAAVEDYVDYDLIGVEPTLHSSCRFEAVLDDSARLASDGSLMAAWQATGPVRFLRAPLGLANEPPGLYPKDLVTQWAARSPNLEWREVPNVNHYTITLGPAGAAEVAKEVSAVTPPE